MAAWASVYQDRASCELDALNHLPRQHDRLMPPVVEPLVAVPATGHPLIHQLPRASHAIAQYVPA